MDTQDKRELISALVDGQVDAVGMDTAVALAAADPDARRAWDTYHLIGDVMRSGELADAASSADFLARLHQRLPPATGLEIAAPHVQPVRSAGREAANDGFGWRWAAGFASLVALGAVVWGLNSAPAGGGAGSAQLAAAPMPAASVAVPSGPGGELMLRDPRLDELMAAHRQLGGATALQTPAGFLRNATFEGPAREGR